MFQQFLILSDRIITQVSKSSQPSQQEIRNSMEHKMPLDTIPRDMDKSRDMERLRDQRRDYNIDRDRERR